MTPRRLRALLLAAGRGERLRPITDATPKCMVEIGGRPLLAHWVESLKRAGVREALVNTHHLPAAVERFAQEASRAGGFTLRTVHEAELLGSAGTIAANAALADDADGIVVVYADNYSDVDLAALVAAHEAGQRAVTMMLFRAPDPTQAGIAEVDASGCVVSFVEKPNRPTSDLANAGVYVFTRDAYREAAAMKRFDLGFDVLPRFVGRMTGWTHPGYHQDIGTHEGLAAVRAHVEQVERTRV